MENSDSPSINERGKKYVIEWLNDNGYSDILKEALQSDEEGIIAKGRVNNILVQVRSFLHPHKPYKLSDYETDLLTRRASKRKLVAYIAYVILDDSGKLAEEINWERLNK